MHKVLVTSPLPGKGLERLEAHCDVTVLSPDELVTEELLKQKVADKHGVISLLSDPFTAEVIAAAPNLKAIANYAVGFNNIDVAAATKQGVLVTNTPDVLTETSADLAWALLMAAARRLIEGDNLTRAGQFTGWKPDLLLGMDVYGKTLGIVGAGRIGQAVARRAQGFSMKVVYHNRNRLPKAREEELNMEYMPLTELLSEADFVSLHCPLTKDTHHLIGRKELELMKPSSILVNTARGPVVDEEVLVGFLQKGKLFAAGFDVYEQEPKLSEGLKELDNVVLAPHIASASEDTRRQMVEMVVDNILAALDGKRPPHLVNADAWQ